MITKYRTKPSDQRTAYEKWIKVQKVALELGFDPETHCTITIDYQASYVEISAELYEAYWDRQAYVQECEKWADGGKKCTI